MPLLRHLKKQEKQRFKELLEDRAQDSDADETNVLNTDEREMTHKDIRCGLYGLALALMGDMDQLRLWHLNPQKHREQKQREHPGKDLGPVLEANAELLDAGVEAVCRARGR